MTCFAAVDSREERVKFGNRFQWTFCAYPIMHLDLTLLPYPLCLLSQGFLPRGTRGPPGGKNFARPPQPTIVPAF